MQTLRPKLQECPARPGYFILLKDHRNKRGYLKADDPDIARGTYKTSFWSLPESHWYHLIHASKSRYFLLLLTVASYHLVPFQNVLLILLARTVPSVNLFFENRRFHDRTSVVFPATGIPPNQGR
jgi:hypothetical protein